ncbi:hypothetical protein ACFQ2K_07430 [Streptomyces sanglieri]|uniref:Uncharacterized protein n=1 Tax=Streptomyces sanglieri TaxID=193460 RepID=A0ABW2WS83_9ACTN
MAKVRENDAGEPAQRTMTPFDDIYDQTDPRAFFRELGAFGYRTPHHAQRIFRRLAALRLRAPGVRCWICAVRTASTLPCSTTT